MMIFYIWDDIRTVEDLGSKHKDAIHEGDSGILKSKVGGNLAVLTIISQ